jgi:hypothetical protein
MSNSRQLINRSGEDIDMLGSQHQFRADWNGRHPTPGRDAWAGKAPAVSWGRTRAQGITGNGGRQISITPNNELSGN